MLQSRFSVLFAFVCVFAGCGSELPVFTEVQIELPDGSELEYPADVVHFDNAQGESITGVFVAPDVAEPMPAVVVLHGAGGLFTKPDSNDDRFETSSQFSEWAAMLTRQGYAVLFPASFYSRGYWDWSRRPDKSVGDRERLLFRVYDAYAALAFLCEQPQVDCDRIAALGFSNGASTTVLSLHERLDEVAGLEKLPPADGRGSFVLGVAYYPGCGFSELVSTVTSDVDEYYFPTAPLRVNHASKDGLLDNCEVRYEQIKQVAALRGLEKEPMELFVYEGATHGFDSSPNNSLEEAARDQARERTLELLAGAL